MPIKPAFFRAFGVAPRRDMEIMMKYIIIIGDGMADEAHAELGGLTPLAYADTPTLDSLASAGRVGTVQTIPAGMAPGSDTANLAILGFDPRRYYSGRSPLEAASLGIPMAEGDVAVRVNLVTLSEDEPDLRSRVIIDHSGGDITTDEARVLIEALRAEMELPFTLHSGVGYRHCLIWEKGDIYDFTPPHDVLGHVIDPYLPTRGDFLTLMERSCHILQNHPINKERRRRGHKPANCLWPWGAGAKPLLPDFYTKTGKRGIIISAVDLMKGIGVLAGMMVADVPGANATIDTDYAGKVDAACEALLHGGHDFAFIHIEAPDEASHQGDLAGKIKAIEYVDARVVAPLHRRMCEGGEDFRLLVMPDHATPLRLRTHSADPVPFLLYDGHGGSADANCTDVQNNRKITASAAFNEEECAKGGYHIEEGHLLIEEFFAK